MKKDIVESKEVKVMRKDVGPMLVAADRIVEIMGEKDMRVATEVLSQLNRYADGFKAEKKKLETPAKATIDAIKALFKPIELEVNPRIEHMRELMGEYQTKVMAEQAEKVKKIADRIGDGKGKIQFETAMTKIANIEEVATNIVTAEGGIRFRTDKKLKIVNSGLIPREYMVPDEAAILIALKAGIEIAGCEIALVSVPINTR